MKVSLFFAKFKENSYQLWHWGMVLVCMCEFVSSWQVLLKETRTVAGPTAKVVLDILTLVCVSRFVNKIFIVVPKKALASTHKG